MHGLPVLSNKHVLKYGMIFLPKALFASEEHNFDLSIIYSHLLHQLYLKWSGVIQFINEKYLDYINKINIKDC